MKTLNFFVTTFILICGVFVLSGCGSDGIKSEAKYPTGAERAGTNDDIYAKPDSIFGTEGFSLSRGKEKDADISGITVNKFLWRAALDTVSFMPLASADPFGGVILTDWYSPPETPKERFKLNVFILDKRLRSDAVSVKLFSQQNQNGTWRDIAVSKDTARKLEDTILTRARQMRVADLKLSDQ